MLNKREYFFTRTHSALQNFAAVLFIICCVSVLYIVFGPRVLEESNNTAMSRPVHDDRSTAAEFYSPPVAGVATKEPHDYLVFLGDIMLARSVELTMKRNGASFPLWYIPAIIASGTTVVANFESAIASPHITTPSLGMRFSTDETFIPQLRSYGITHVSLANNHSLDYGKSGAILARQLLNQAGIETFGNGISISSTSVTYVKHNGLQVALVGIHTLFHEPTDSELTSLMSEVALRSDKQIAILHWGTEYELRHTPEQERFARLLVAAGFDLIVGGHPHVAEDIDMLDHVPVIYSLGNFIFDQYFSPPVQEGFAVVVHMTKASSSLELRPYHLYAHTQPHLMTIGDRLRFLSELAARSNPDLSAQILAQNIAF